MNERIKELQSQAFLQCKAFEDGSVIRTDEAFEKFAELIVKECTNVLRKEWFDENNKVSEEGPREVAMRVGRKNALLAAIDKVKKHFGVE